MSEDNEFENEWGTKKQKYYSMNKRENNSSESDSDFIEEEKEAIRLQKLRAQKIKKAQLLNEEEENENNLEKKNLEKKENELDKNISFKILEIDGKKILENIDTIKNSLEEIQTTEDEINIFQDNQKLNNKLPKTLEYLKLYQKINLINSANVLFNIISTLEQKMTGHHPSIKNTAIMNFLLNKNSEKNEQIQNEIEKILLNLEKKDNNEENIEENEFEQEEENEELENEEFENEELEEFEEEEEIEQIKNKEIKSNNLLMEKIDKIKKPSFLSKKKRREENENKEIDKKANENFEINSESDKSNDENSNSDDSFIKEQYKSFNKLNKEKELLDKEKENQEKKEIEKKNDFAIRKANKEVLKARGIYRKRKKYQGNAKLMNREKFYKKEKERRKLVKEYEGKPDVYMGEATGIRRDLIRSTKIH